MGAQLLEPDLGAHPGERPDEALVRPEKYDRDGIVEWFREVPIDLIDWTVRNSHRDDLGRLALNRGDELVTDRVLPVAERRVMQWNYDPYTLDGGSGGRIRNDGAFVLLPYWMARYHRLIE